MISKSLISGLIVLAIVYIPAFLGLNEVTILSLIGLHTIPGIIYSLTQYSEIIKFQKSTSDLKYYFILTNSIIYFFIIQYINCEIIGSSDFRIITAGGLGALFYLLTFPIFLKLKLPFKTYLLGILIGLADTVLYWYLNNKYYEDFIFIIPIIIFLWQVGLAMTIQFTCLQGQQILRRVNTSIENDEIS